MTAGANDCGQLGLNTKDSSPIPVKVPILSPAPCIDIAATARASFVLTQSGELYSWGSGPMIGQGEGGDRLTARTVTVPTGVSRLLSCGCVGVAALATAAPGIPLLPYILRGVLFLAFVVHHMTS